MLETFVITLREGVEAALVIAIAIATIRKSGRPDLLPAVYRGLITAVIACVLGAWAFTTLGISSDSYEGYTLLASAVFVFSMVIWMNRHGRTMKAEIEQKLQPHHTAGSWGVFLFVFLMIFREGVETVLLLAAVRLNTSGLLEGLGAVLGIVLAILFGISFVRGTIKVNIRQFFQMTSAILMVVVVQLGISGLHELSESQVLPSGLRGNGPHRPHRQKTRPSSSSPIPPRHGRRHDDLGVAQTPGCENGRPRRSRSP